MSNFPSPIKFNHPIYCGAFYLGSDKGFGLIICILFSQIHVLHSYY